MQAIKCYLCLLSPVSAWKRKRVRVWQGGREWRTECAKDKNHCLLLLWPHACTPVWVDAFLPWHTHISNKATALHCLISRCEDTSCSTAPHQKYRGNQTVAENQLFSATHAVCSLLPFFQIIFWPSLIKLLDCIITFFLKGEDEFKFRLPQARVCSSVQLVHLVCEPKASSLPSGGRLQ